MSYLERAITDGHAKLTGEGKQQAVPAPNGGARVPRAALAIGKFGGADQLHVAVNHTERYADPEEQVRAGFWAELPQRVAQASAPAGCGSVPLPVHGRATSRGGTPLEPAAGTAALRSNNLQPVSKEALIGAIKKCHQTLWAGGKLSPALYEFDPMNPFPKKLLAKLGKRRRTFSC